MDCMRHIFLFLTIIFINEVIYLRHQECREMLIVKSLSALI